MALQVNVHEAKSQLSRLVARAENGEEVVIARAGKPIVRLVPVKRSRLRLGILDVDTPEDFFDPMTEDELAAWE